MRETEGFDVFLKARRYGPLVPPELVSLQIRFHPGEEVLDLYEHRTYGLGNALAVLGPPSHDTVEAKNELLREVRDISTGLSRERGCRVKRKAMKGRVDLDQSLSRFLVAVQLRTEDVEERNYLLSRAQTVASRVHDRGGREVIRDEYGTFSIGSVSPLVCSLLLLVPTPPCLTLRSQDVPCAG